MKIDTLFIDAYSKCLPRLLGIARSIVRNPDIAEDVVQESMASLYKHRNRYDWNKPIGLMKKTVANAALKTLRRPKMSLVTDDHFSRYDPPISHILTNESIGQVRKAIEHLPEHYRTALVLFEYQEMSYEQIATVLDVTVAQIKTWIYRGRKQIAERLKDYYEK